MNTKYLNLCKSFRLTSLCLTALLTLFSIGELIADDSDSASKPSISPIDSLANDLVQTLAGLGENQVLLGKFTGPAVMQANAGAGISKQLADALAKRNVSISRSAKFAIQGSYTRLINDAGRVQIVIRGEFENNRTGQAFGQFEKVISASSEQNIANLAKWFGINAHVPTNLPTKHREKILTERMQVPQHKIAAESTRLKTDKQSPYAVELLTWKGSLSPGTNPASLPYRTRKITEVNGQPFVPIEKGDVYAIRIINDSSSTAAVSVAVDGLSIFSFADVGDPAVILQPDSSATIYGWYRSAKRSDAFRITSYAESAAAELGTDPNSVGVISIAFRQAWGEDEAIPEDELAAKLLASRGQNATGRGTSIVQNYRPWKGQIGAIRDIISVRYDRAQ